MDIPNDSNGLRANSICPRFLVDFHLFDTFSHVRRQTKQRHHHADHGKKTSFQLVAPELPDPAPAAYARPNELV